MSEIKPKEFVSSLATMPGEHSLLYKSPNLKNTQADRRLQLLNLVKQRRIASIDEKRGISELFNSSTENEEEPMEVVNICKKIKRKYACKLMLSEYFFECPVDMESCWLFKLCPKGVRNLVVAQRGTTKSFNKAGIFITEFPSMLPGGNSRLAALKFTILDCVYNPDLGTYFVLDILAWNSYSLLNCSSEFRFFFLKSKLDENEELKSRNIQNRFSFINTPSLPAELPLIENSLHSSPDCNVPLDGILFYHKEVDYISGVTPLVGWLQPFMVPEILHIPVHPDYSLLRPTDYTNLTEYAELQRKQRKKRKKKVCDVEMVELTEECDTSNSMDAC